MLKSNQHYLNVELPRELILLNPTFTCNQTLMPVENYLKGSYIHLSFETTCDQENVVYMTSSYLNYAITIEPQGDMLRVVSVQNLTE